MFKFLGMLTGGILIIIAGIAWLDAPQAKKVSSQLHNELDTVIDQVAQSSINLDKVPITKEDLPIEVQELIDSAEDVAEQDNVIDDAGNTALSWHIFWKPFRSLPSAEGFAALLSKQTGITISVVANDKKQYMVYFSHFDEEDKQRILHLIEDKTGLQVSTS